jgi:predicted transcriptional regulator
MRSRRLSPNTAGLKDLESLEGLYGFKEDAFRRMMTEHGLWKQPIDDICRKAATLTVKDIMRTPTQGEYVAENATLNEAVHQLILGHHQSLLVTRGAEIVGVLRLSDVFHRIGDLMAECKL